MAKPLFTLDIYEDFSRHSEQSEESIPKPISHVKDSSVTSFPQNDGFGLGFANDSSSPLPLGEGLSFHCEEGKRYSTWQSHNLHLMRLPRGQVKLYAKFNITRCVEPKNDEKKTAFTLAEVLITLGIIGVVAALTIPTLISNHRKKEVVTKLEKVYSVMNQAIVMSESVNGDFSDWYPDCGPSSAPTCSSDDVLNWYNEYLGKYIITTKIVESGIKKDNIGLYFTDGSILFIGTYVSDMRFFTNEKAIKNTVVGKNAFNFNFGYNKSESAGWEHMNQRKFELYSWGWDGTREGLINNQNNYGCSKSGIKAYCGKLIQYEGWQIPDDYPIKF